MDKNKMTQNVDIDDIESFLQGELSEQRDKEVAEAINSNSWIQEYIEASLDIDDMVMFDELSRVTQVPQNNSPKRDFSIVVPSSGGDSKWGKYLSRNGNQENGASKREQGDYRHAANEEERELTKLKFRKWENVGENGKEKSYWTTLLVSISIMMVIILFRSCEG